MTIKVGDKVKIIRESSRYRGKFGIVGIMPTIGEDGAVFIDKYNSCYIDCEIPIEQQLELVEVAHYIPVPKFKIGDIVYDKDGKKHLILEERDDNLRYRCWSYTFDTDVLMFEERLTREVVTEVIENDN